MIRTIILVLICIIFISMNKMSTEVNNLSAEKKIVVGYDFDDCLKKYDDKQTIQPVLNKLKEDLSRGNKVVIITARGKLGLPEIYDFLTEHGIKNQVDVYHTGDTEDRRKSRLVKELNVSRFYDDQPGFLEDIRLNAPHVQLYKTTPDATPVITTYY